MGGTYAEVNEVLYPDITVSEEANVWVGKYGLIWIDYMKSNHVERYRHHIRVHITVDNKNPYEQLKKSQNSLIMYAH